MNKNIKDTHVMTLYVVIIALCSSALTMFSGCGKQEATGGTLGAASGALLGAAVTGRHDHGTGALIGGLAGGFVGSTIGRAGDEKEAAEERATVEMGHRQEVAGLKEENLRLREKWCSNCGQHVTLSGAKSCPGCGGELIRERYCPTCSHVFSPSTGYKYCPFCKENTRLLAR
jgi:hypothetical protein